MTFPLAMSTSTEESVYLRLRLSLLSGSSSVFKIIKICDFLELEFDQNASVQDFHVSDGVRNVDKISVYVKKFKFAETKCEILIKQKK